MALLNTLVFKIFLWSLKNSYLPMTLYTTHNLLPTTNTSFPSASSRPHFIHTCVHTAHLHAPTSITSHCQRTFRTEEVCFIHLYTMWEVHTLWAFLLFTVLYSQNPSVHPTEASARTDDINNTRSEVLSVVIPLLVF